jgi:hypothetical protein
MQAFGPLGQHWRKTPIIIMHHLGEGEGILWVVYICAYAHVCVCVCVNVCVCVYVCVSVVVCVLRLL